MYFLTEKFILTFNLIINILTIIFKFYYELYKDLEL